jgi:signal transduction histidine kinase
LLTERLAALSDVHAFHEVAVQELRHVAEADGVLLARPSKDSLSLWSVAQLGRWPDVPSRICDARGHLAKWLRVNDEVLIVEDRRQVIEFLSESERDFLRRHSVSACVPLMVGHELAGMVLLVYRESAQASRVPWGLVLRCARYVASTADVVSDRQAERERAAAAGRAQQLAVAGQIAAAVAHEVRNPLATIRSSVQLVADSSADWSRKSELLQHVVEEVDRINRTLSAVLGFSRPQPLEQKDVDLASVINDVLVLVEPYVAHQRLVLSRHVAAGQFTVSGDPGALQQVLLNVLLNACQATSSGGHLDVSLESETLRAIARVSDTGTGIPADRLPRIFEPFFTTKTSGSGLGLSICRDIVTRHGGEIDVTSEVGRGTVVTVALPLVVSR